MADPFLLAHLVHPLFFDIGGRLAPISIRDQMVRARTAVDRGLEQGLIGLHRPLLVLGAGAAGATAAIRSAARGVPTLLLEAAPGPFLRQAGCRTRWVDPVQYDWPVDHWQMRRYHWTSPAMPLPWAAGPANQIALTWTRTLNRARQQYPRLQVLCRTYMVPPPVRTADVLQVRLTSRGLPLLVVRIGMVLSCVGAGTEISTHNSYSGFDFWSTDPFQRLTQTHQVLISGGGDGALQDYLRVVTGRKAAEEIYTQLGIPIAIEQLLQSAEDQAGRVYIWGSEPRHDHDALLRLQQVHQAVLDKLLPGPGHRAPLPSLPVTLSNFTAAMPDTVKLMYPCTHFSRCYGLNRFLVLLLATYLQRYRRVDTLLPGRRLHDVQGLGHRCSNSPSTCHGQPHLVAATGDPDCRMPQSSDRELVGSFNVVIVRHGIAAPPPLVVGAQPFPQPRQMLPYHVAT